MGYPATYAFPIKKSPITSTYELPSLTGDGSGDRNAAMVDGGRNLHDRCQVGEGQRRYADRVSQMKSIAIPLALILLYVPAHAQSGTGRDPAALIRLWKQENEKCRGGSGNDPRTDAACASRQTYDAKLRAIGWCYEYQGAATVDWHPCASKSRR